MGRRIDEMSGTVRSAARQCLDKMRKKQAWGSIILRGQKAVGNTTLGTQMMNARVSALSLVNGCTSFGLMSLTLRTVQISGSSHFHNYNYNLYQFIRDF